MEDVKAGRTDILTSKDVNVYMAFTKDQFDVPAVVLRIESGQDEPVRLQLTGTLPPELEGEKVAFHPEYDSDSWSIEGDLLTYETELDSNEDVTTMFAMQELSTVEGDTLLDIIEIENVEILSADEAGTRGHNPTAQAEPETTTAAPSEPAADRAGKPGIDPSTIPTDELVEEFKRRHADEAVSDEAEAELQAHLLERSGTSYEGIEQRVSHLQQRVSDVEAFSASMEAVLDRYGSPIEAFEELEAELEAQSEQLATVTNRIETLDERTDEIEPRVDALEEHVTAIEDEQDAIKATVSELTEWQETLKDSLASLFGES